MKTDIFRYGTAAVVAIRLRAVSDLIRYGLVEQGPGSKVDPVPQPLHGPIRAGNRVYFGYGTSISGTLQIVDRDKLLKGNPASPNPFAPTPENILYAQLGRLDLYPNTGAHTTFPVLGVPISEFCCANRKLYFQEKIPELDVAGSIPVARSRIFVQIKEPTLESAEASTWLTRFIGRRLTHSVD